MVHLNRCQPHLNFTDSEECSLITFYANSAVYESLAWLLIFERKRKKNWKHLFQQNFYSFVAKKYHNLMINVIVYGLKNLKEL